MKRGFSTLELMIAFALLTIVLTGVVLSQFSANYWQIASETSNEALYIAKTHLEVLRGASKGEFTMASSTPQKKELDTACAAGGLCYYVSDTVSDLSACSKYLNSKVDWSVQNYPTTTTSLYTITANPTEAILLGGDCPLLSPAGSWTKNPTLEHVAVTLNGNVTGVDSLEGIVFATQDAPPYFATDKAGTLTQKSFGEVTVLNGLDVARDEATGRTYAYVTRNDPAKQLSIIDVTDIANPATTTRPFALGVSGDVTSPTAYGWRVFLYDRKAYVVTKQTGQPDFHIVDVGNPAVPVEKGDALINTTINDLIVRDRKVTGVTHRYAYLATTNTTKEVIVLDVTSPTSISTVATIDLPDTPGCTAGNSPNATSLSLSGTTLYVGREFHLSCAQPTLYSINLKNQANPVLTALITGSTVLGLRVSGDLAFMETGSQAAAPSSNLMDIDATDIFSGKAISSGTETIQVISLKTLSQQAAYTFGPGTGLVAVLKNTP